MSDTMRLTTSEEAARDNSVLLSPETYRVMRRVPATWWDEQQTVEEIAGTLGDAPTAIRRRIAHLVALGLVERRRRSTIAPTTELRRMVK
jgi:DNA-binding MarR family transcriptional regulator